MDFFDANIFIGCPPTKVYQPVANSDELMQELAKRRISKALVWHIAQYEYSPDEGNRILVKEIAGKNRLLGCWTILPPQTGEVIKQGFFLEMKKNEIVALRAFPEYHRYILNRVVFGNFLEEIVERSIPLMLSLNRGITWQNIYQLLSEFPNLTCILCDIGIWGVDRYIWPLLEKYPTLYLETSLLSLENYGLEATVQRFGSDKIVFGSGFPERYPESAMLQLLHADIPEYDKKKIAGLNLENLIAKVKL